MKWLLRTCLIVLCSLCPNGSLGQDVASGGEPDTRPKIGLALSGGGARGYAHIGILKVFEEQNIPIDYIAATSMGAMVGGFHATGLSASEIEEILLSLDWVSLYDDEPARRDRAYRRKEEDQRYILDFELGQKGPRLVVPKGLSSWRKMNFLLRSNLQPVAHIKQFQDLPIPFKAMVTDVVTGESVALDHGDLAATIRASMSLPGLFAPQVIEGKSYLDGGIVNNLPVDTVREMGADVVVAVDIGSQLRGEDELNEMKDFSGQSRGFLARQVVEEMLSRADVILSPDLGDLGPLAFSEREAILRLGQEEAEQKLASLRPYALSDEAYALHLRRRQARASFPEKANFLASIVIRGAERVDERVVRERIRLKEGDRLDYEILHDDLDRVFGLGDFEWVDYELDAREDGSNLTILLKEKFWGPNYVHGGIEIGIDSDQNSAINPLINYTRTRLNRLGGEWRTDLRFGELQNLSSEFYQPLRFDGRLFIAASLESERIFRKFVVPNQELIEFESTQTYGKVDLGVNFGTYGEARVGVLTGRTNISLSSSDATNHQRIDIGGLSLGFLIDRLDSLTFPRRGVLAAASAYLSKPGLGAQDEYDLLGVSFVWAATRRNHTFLWWTEAGTSETAPLYASFSLGGFFSLSGYDRGELSGAHFGVIRPIYFYKIGNLPSLVGKGIYLGGWLEAGNTWLTRDDISRDDLRYAATVTLGAETVLGPVYLSLGMAEDNRQRVYLSIGRTF